MEFRVAIIHTPQCKAGLYLPSNIKVPLRQIWQTNISAPPKTLNLKNAYFVVILHSISILIKSILSLILGSYPKKLRPKTQLWPDIFLDVCVEYSFMSNSISSKGKVSVCYKCILAIFILCPHSTGQHLISVFDTRPSRA